MRVTRFVFSLLIGGGLVGAAACGIDVIGVANEGAPSSASSSSGGDASSGNTSGGTSGTTTSGGLDEDGMAPENDAGPLDDGGLRCRSTRGPKLVAVDGKFCIDATEVTNDDYLPFYLAAGGGDAGVAVPAECVWNTSYLPPGWSATTPYFPAGQAGNVPVHPVDWCDAWMFCRWAGKRLCGSVNGQAMAPAGAPDAATNAWSYACSAAGTKAYPYGPTYQATACNTDNSSGTPRAAGAQCVGGYPGIVDMSGNAWEWDDTCAAGNETANCNVRGGSAQRPPEEVSCVTALAAPRNDATGNNGIRCCKYE